MKSINIYLNERFGDHFTKYRYFPKDKDDLRDIIKEKIRDKGVNCDLNDIDVSKITDMSRLFNPTASLNDDLAKFNGNISKWDVSNVKNMSNMFELSKFNGYIGDWNVSNVEDMDSMFASSEFNQDISGWDVSHVIYMSNMFSDSEFNQDISSWDVSNVKSMVEMFKNSEFYQDISSWDCKSITIESAYEDIFYGCDFPSEYWPKFNNIK